MEIVAAIRAVHEGGYYVTKSMMGYLLNRKMSPKTASGTDKTLADLSPIERRILSLIARQKSSKAIADELGVALRTVENRRAAICEKLSLTGVNSLLKYAIDHKTELA